MGEVSPNFKPKGPCGCGCDLFGLPKKNGCVRGCKCVRCRNKNNRVRGDAKARVARKRLGLVGANTRHEEHWGGPVRTEVKSDLRHAKPVQTAYENTRRQSEQARPMGDTRPYVASFAPPGTSHTYTVIRDDDLEPAVFALAEAWGFGGAA